MNAPQLVLSCSSSKETHADKQDLAGQPCMEGSMWTPAESETTHTVNATSTQRNITNEEGEHKQESRDDTGKTTAANK